MMNIQKFAYIYEYFDNITTGGTIDTNQIKAGMKITFNYTDSNGNSYSVIDLIREVNSKTITLCNVHYYVTSLNAITNVKIYKYPDGNEVLNIIKILENVFGLKQWNMANSYSIGDYVIYNGSLYVCTSEVGTQQNFNTSCWTETYIFKF